MLFRSHAFGHTISWNILLPGLIIPGLVFTPIALYPWIESWVTGDKREHHLLDRPRNKPNRTALGAATLAFFAVALINGGNDLIATHFHLSINQIMWFARIGIIVIPIITFIVTKRLCLSLQRADRDLVLHGRETGRLVRLPHGEFVEIHEPLSKEEIWKLASHEQPGALEMPAQDANGVRPKGPLLGQVRNKLAKSDAEQISKPTALELEEGSHH